MAERQAGEHSKDKKLGVGQVENLRFGGGRRRNRGTWVETGMEDQNWKKEELRNSRGKRKNGDRREIRLEKNILRGLLPVNKNRETLNRNATSRDENTQERGKSSAFSSL